MEPLRGASESKVDVLESKRLEIMKVITARIDEYEGIWRVLSTEQQSCCFLILKQTFLSARFGDFSEIWKQIKFDEKADLLHLFLIVNEEVNRVGDFLTDFEDKAQKASAILKDAIESLQKGLDELNAIKAACLKATKLEQLEALRIPDCSNVQILPYPDVNEMCEKWDEFHLDGKLDACFEALEMLNFQ